MKIKTIEVGLLYTNCYILEKNNEVFIIDPGDNAEKIKREIENKKVKGIIITHYHFDHIGALEELKEEYKCEVYDFKNLKSGNNKIGHFDFEVISCPGHKEDLISIYFREENILFCGDFIFKGSIGRFDLEGGSLAEMKKSIKNILTYPKNMIIYPGHGMKTKLCDEFETLKGYLNY